MTSQHNTGTHPFYIGMYIHIYTHIYVHIYTSQKECLCIFHGQQLEHLRPCWPWTCRKANFRLAKNLTGNNCSTYYPVGFGPVRNQILDLYETELCRSHRWRVQYKPLCWPWACRKTSFTDLAGNNCGIYLPVSVGPVRN